MTDRPIIFSGPMVRALLEGRKTQTRRLATSPLRKCEPGDRLYVRETFRHWQGSASRKTACYVADGVWIDHGSGWTGKPDGITWLTPATPSIHMPRWASRLTLIVEAVRVEPLQVISESDAVAEGLRHVIPASHRGIPHWAVDGLDLPQQMDARMTYRLLWERLHGRASWAANPDVLVLTFRVEHGNIDRIAA